MGRHSGRRTPGHALVPPGPESQALEYLVLLVLASLVQACLVPESPALVSRGSQASQLEKREELTVCPGLLVVPLEFLQVSLPR